MGEGDTRDRVIAAERDIIHLTELYGKVDETFKEERERA